jgi:D-apiose dehydrogenase
MSNLRFGIIGTGFWARFQLAAWKELDGVECVALYNRTRQKAEALAKEFQIPSVYDDPEEMIRKEDLNFIDIITDVTTHSPMVNLAIKHGLPVICQKPMATTFKEAEEMVRRSKEAKVPLFIHENWRWQRPIREFKKIMDSGRVGESFRARIHFCSSFPVFDNQPFLKTLDQFILTDVGSHILDVARFLFGEAKTLYCTIKRIHNDIKGEDVATVVMVMGDNDITVTCEMSYASRTEHERFPETYIFLEGRQGSLELGPDYWIRVTTSSGTFSKRYPPAKYQWVDPAYELVHSSIVPCNADLLNALQGKDGGETSGEDNLKTVKLVFSSYESALSSKVVEIND